MTDSTDAEATVAQGNWVFVPLGATICMQQDTQRTPMRGGTIRMPTTLPPRAFRGQAPQLIMPRNVPRTLKTELKTETETVTSHTTEVVTTHDPIANAASGSTTQTQTQMPDMACLLAAAKVERDGWDSVVKQLVAANADADAAEEQQATPTPTPTSSSDAARKRPKVANPKVAMKSRPSPRVVAKAKHIATPKGSVKRSFGN